MSFYCNNYHSENCPGAINPAQNNGLCEKTCLQVKKVFDAGIRQFTLENQVLTLGTPVGNDPVFISGRSTCSKAAVSNLLIENIDECQNLSRVKADINIPLEIFYSDSNCSNRSAITCLTLNQDVILCLPEASIMPYEIEAVVSCVIPEGKFVCANTLVAALCITIIMKVVIEVELLVPSYGYCPIPPLQDYTHEVCTGFFELPLFPKTPCCRKK